MAIFKFSSGVYYFTNTRGLKKDSVMQGFNVYNSLINVTTISDKKVIKLVRKIGSTQYFTVYLETVYRGITKLLVQ